MKKMMIRSTLLSVLSICISAHGYSNPIEGGSTESVSDQWDVSLPWLYIGSNSSYNNLFVTSGGLVNNQIGVLGNNSSSTHNIALVAGGNAVWNNATELSVGNLGSNNALGIFGGGQVNAANTYIGKASSNNFAQVGDAGSELSTTTLHVGHTGSENNLEIISGGLVSSSEASIGHWIGSDNNSVLVTGINSVWNNTGTLNIGEYGSENSLIVMDGGAVQSPVVNLGVYTTSSNNTVSVYGENANLTASELNIGGTATTAGGIGNRVSVRDGGTVSTTDLTIHAGNNLDLNDGGTFSIDNDFDATTEGFNFNAGGTLEVGGGLTYSSSVSTWIVDIEDQRSIVLNGSNAYWQVPGLHSTLNVGNNTSGNSLVLTNGGSGYVSHAFIGQSQNSHSNEVKVVEGGTWRNQSLMVGAGGDENRLLISENGRIENITTGIGYKPGSDSNVVTVAGENAVLHSSEAIHLGGYKPGTEWNDGGSGNSLVVSDGGLVLVGDVDTNNLPIIGTAGGIVVGDTTGEAEMIVANQSMVSAPNTYIGLGAGERGTVQVMGSNTVWDTGFMSVGGYGAGSSFDISNGAMGVSEDVLIGYRGDGNTVTITGNDSVWSNDWIKVGSDGFDNSLRVLDGATVYSSAVGVSQASSWFNPVGSNNTLWVSGVGSTLSIEDGLDIGKGELLVAEGGRVLSGFSFIQGAVAVEGSGSVWSNGWLNVSNGSLIVSDGGSVFTESAVVSGQVSVDENGSEWIVENDLYLDGLVEVRDGGQISTGTTTIDDGSMTTVTGEGSTLDVASVLKVGEDGEGSSLTVEDGGLVLVGEVNMNNLPTLGTGGGVVVGDSSGDAEMVVANQSLVSAPNTYIGLGADESGSLIVRGEGTAWNNTGDLYVGHQGSGSSLWIEDGGQVNSINGLIGNGQSSVSNQVVVSGAGSMLKMNEIPPSTGGGPQVTVASGYLYVGMEGQNNSLTLLDGAVVEDLYGVVGGMSTASNNKVQVSGAGSQWRNSKGLYLGGWNYPDTLPLDPSERWNDGGTGNSLTIEDGGLVLVGDVNTNNLPNIGTAGGLVVGDATGDAELYASNESMIDSGNVFLGFSSNEYGSVTLDGGARMDVSNSLFVGHSGSENRLSVLEGASLHSGDSIIGYDGSSSGNSVVISGTNSLWTAETVSVGYNGSDNHLSLLDGGTVRSDQVMLSHWYSGSSSNNTLEVRGQNSTLTTGRFNAGDYGSSNLVEVSNGGRIEAEILSVGASYTSDDNVFKVTGSGSSLDAKTLIVGHIGSDNNNLIISDGAYVLTEGFAYIGHDYTASDNSAIITGPTSEWTIDRTINVGHRGAFNSLTISNGGLVSAGWGNVGNAKESTGNSLTVTGVGSKLNLINLFIGNEGSDNSMVISNGGQVVSSEGYVGYADGSDGNRVTVSGTGSVWQNHDGLYLGGFYEGANWIDGGTGNSLTVSNSGWVLVGNVETNNLPSIGTGGGIVVGDASGIPEMVAENGSLVESSRGFIGLGAAESGSVVVSGAGSVWDNTVYGPPSYSNSNPVDSDSLYDDPVVGPQGDLSVGYAGSGNRLSIMNGGRVNGSAGYIGHGEMAKNNSVMVSGAGSVWQNSGQLNVGYNGSGNSLRIEDGGKVYAMNGSIGYGEGADGNRVTVTGEGSVWGHGWTVPRYSEGLTVEYEWPTNFPPIVVQPPIGWPGISNFPPIVVQPPVIWPPALTNYPINPQPPFVVFPVTNTYGGTLTSGGTISGSGSLVINGGGTVTLGGNNTFTNGSIWTSGGLVVGSIQSNNVLVLNNGGTILGSGDLVLNTNNVVVLSNGGTIIGGEGLSINSGNELTVINGGTFGGTGVSIETLTNGLTGATATGGDGFVLSSNNVVIQGGSFTGGRGGSTITNELITITNYPPILVTPILAMASWGDLSIGRGGSDNVLEISDGALVANYHGIIGETSNAWNNVVSVTGTNSEWRNVADLYVGGRMSQYYYLTSNGWKNEWLDGGRGNSLYVGDGGLVTVGRDLHNRNYSSISVDPGASINVASNYYQDATSSLRFGVETNSTGAPLNALVSVGGTAEFEAGARIEYASNVGQLQFETVYTNKIIAADQLIVAGVEDADSLDLEMLDASGTLVDVIFWENDQDIYGLVGRNYLADSAGFASNSMMSALSKEVDDLSLLGDDAANRMINLLNTLSGSQQAAQMEQQYSRGAPAYQHSRSMTEGMNEIKKHTALSNQTRQTAPEGAKGPYRADQELQGWIKPYGMWADHAAKDGFSGYDQSVYGTVIGLDQPLETALVGVAGGYGHSKLSQDDGDESTAQTGYGVVYLNWGTDDWFYDANIGFGRSSIDQTSGTEFGNSADYDASNFALQLGGGKEIKINRCWAITPKASALWTYYYQEAYTETSSQGVARMVDAYERNSLLSRLGAAVSWKKELKTMTLMPEARLYWLHEFNDDEGRVDYEVANGLGGEYHFLMAAPESDVLEAGLGISCILNGSLQFVFDVDGRFGEDYSAYALSGRAVVEF